MIEGADPSLMEGEEGVWNVKNEGAGGIHWKLSRNRFERCKFDEMKRKYIGMGLQH